MKPIRRQAAAAAAKTGRGPVTKKVLVGPNRNLLGTREPAVHGHHTLADIIRRLQTQAETAGVGVQTTRTEDARFIVINPAGLTRTSVALRDAFAVDRLGG